MDGCDNCKNTGLVQVIAILQLNDIELSSLSFYITTTEKCWWLIIKKLLSYSENWFQADKYRDVYTLVLPPAGDAPVCP